MIDHFRAYSYISGECRVPLKIRSHVDSSTRPGISVISTSCLTSFGKVLFGLLHNPGLSTSGRVLAPDALHLQDMAELELNSFTLQLQTFIKICSACTCLSSEPARETQTLYQFQLLSTFVPIPIGIHLLLSIEGRLSSRESIEQH